MNPDVDVYTSQKTRKHLEKRKKQQPTETKRILNIMSTKGVQFLHLACQWGRLAAPPSLVTPLGGAQIERPSMRIEHV